MPFADLGDVRLFYTDDGPTTAARAEQDAATAGRPALLLVHGFGADSHDWVWHIPALSVDRRVIAVDLRGHGYSSAPEHGYRPQDLAGDLVGLLDLLGVERVVAFGHSMGGLVVSALAIEHPDRVRALVCVDPGYGKPDSLAPYLATLAGNMRADAHAQALANDEWCYTPASPAFLRSWHARKILGTPAHVLAEAFTAMFDADGQFGFRTTGAPYLIRRTCPVLSFSFDPEQSAWEAGLFEDPLSTTVTWAGSGHRLHAERPAEFLLVVQDWLGKLD